MDNPRGGGGVYFDTYVGSGHFLGSKILNFNILGFFRKINFFFGMNILWIFFWRHHKIGLVLGVFLCIFLGLFLR